MKPQKVWHVAEGGSMFVWPQEKPTTGGGKEFYGAGLVLSYHDAVKMAQTLGGVGLDHL